MGPSTILLIIGLYFLGLIAISYFTGKGANNETFFLANKSAPWYLVAFGMIGASLSGITFISIPGSVGAGDPTKQFGYMQMVLGYLVGYLIIAYVLMPIYYRLNLTSIYSYLRDRFGKEAHKIGAFYFLLSRITGASIRLLLVANVLQAFVFNDLGVPFEVTVLVSILLIWLYTFKGGIKTILWTDTLQTLFMLLSLGFTIWIVADELNLSEGIISAVSDSGYSKIFFFENGLGGSHFIKMFLGGIFIAIGMTGLDQDMMQKNLSCKNIKEAQKNMMSFAAVLVVVNLIFLALGALLYLYSSQQGITVPEKTDLLFPTIALKSVMPIGVGVLFLLGLIAAAYSSADSALTSLTTSVCVDFISDVKEVTKKVRQQVHIVMSILLYITIIVLSKTLDESAIWQLIRLAGFTYGPLIGLFFFGILTKRKIDQGWTIILICVLAPVLSWFVDAYSKDLLGGFSFGATLIIVNALISFVGLYVVSHKRIPA